MKLNTDHRNDTAHLYGEAFAEATLKLLPQVRDRRPPSRNDHRRTVR